jgi:hypothetical protein
LNTSPLSQSAFSHIFALWLEKSDSKYVVVIGLDEKTFVEKANTNVHKSTHAKIKEKKDFLNISYLPKKNKF